VVEPVVEDVIVVAVGCEVVIAVLVLDADMVVQVDVVAKHVVCNAAVVLDVVVDVNVLENEKAEVVAERVEDVAVVAVVCETVVVLLLLLLSCWTQMLSWRLL